MDDGYPYRYVWASHITISAQFAPGILFVAKQQGIHYYKMSCTILDGHGVAYECPRGTKSVSIPFNTVWGEQCFVFRSATTLELADGPPQQDNVCFNTILTQRPSPLVVFNIRRLREVLMTPIALLQIHKKATFPQPWPCSQANSFVVVCLEYLDSSITRIVALNLAHVRKQDTIPLRNYIRTLQQEVDTKKNGDFYTAKVFIGPSARSEEYTVALAFRDDEAAAEVGAAHEPADDAEHRDAAHEPGEPGDDDAMLTEAGSTASANPIAIAAHSVLLFPIGPTDGYMVLDVETSVRVRKIVQWELEEHTRDPSPHHVDVRALVMSPPLALDIAIGQSDGSDTPGCFVFCMKITRGKRTSILVVWRKKLYHLSLDGIPSTSDLGHSASSFTRACRGKPSFDFKEGRQRYVITFSVLAHRRVSLQGPVPESERLHIQWTALLSRAAAEKLRDKVGGHRGARTSGSAAVRTDGSDSDDESERSESAQATQVAPREGTIGAFFSHALSCANRAIALTRPMWEAMRALGGVAASFVAGTEKRSMHVPRGTKVMRPNAADDTDAAEVPSWNGLDLNAFAFTSSNVSACSALAWQVGLVEEASEDQYDYSVRQLTTAADTPLAAIARRVQHMHPHGQSVCSPPLARGNPVIHDVDIDLWEVLLQATTSTCVMRNALTNAAIALAPLDGAEDINADAPPSPQTAASDGDDHCSGSDGTHSEHSISGVAETSRLEGGNSATHHERSVCID